MDSIRAAGVVRIGGGAGYSGDRLEPAVDLARDGALDYLVFECLAERTIALAQQARAADPAAGYDPGLADRLTAVLPLCRAAGTRIVTNMGAANPEGAVARTLAIAAELRLQGLTVASVTGDDVLDRMVAGGCVLEETGRPVAELGSALVSASAYIGAEALAEALDRGADVVIAGRAADPSLFLAALLHAFRWRPDDWRRLGRGTVVGHLLECAGQVTGGYFADPEMQPVDGLDRLGFPIAEVTADGDAVVTKLPGTGGAVTTATCKAQLLYEIHDPSRYLTPDVTADFTGVRLATVGPDRVQVTGGNGTARPDRLKVSVGYRNGYVGEGQISYAGAGAVSRARQAIEIVKSRLAQTGVDVRELRTDLIGIDALHGAAAPAAADADVRRRVDPYEVRVRIAGRTGRPRDAERIGAEVEALYTNGPAGGGGAARSIREVLAIGTTFVPRDWVRPVVRCERV